MFARITALPHARLHTHTGGRERQPHTTTVATTHTKAAVTSRCAGLTVLTVLATTGGLLVMAPPAAAATPTAPAVSLRLRALPFPATPYPATAADIAGVAGADTTSGSTYAQTAALLTLPLHTPAKNTLRNSLQNTVENAPENTFMNSTVDEAGNDLGNAFIDDLVNTPVNAPQNVASATTAAFTTTSTKTVTAAKKSPYIVVKNTNGCAKIFYKKYGTKTLPVAGFCGRKMSTVEMVTVLRKAGWSWKAMPNALATFMGESGGYVNAYRANRTSTGRLLSTDRSWTQINDAYHPAIKTMKYTNPVVAATYARTLAQRYGLRIWVAYQHRTQHLPAANAAIRTARAHGVR